MTIQTSGAVMSSGKLNALYLYLQDTYEHQRRKGDHIAHFSLKAHGNLTT